MRKHSERGQVHVICGWYNLLIQILCTSDINENTENTLYYSQVIVTKALKTLSVSIGYYFEILHCACSPFWKITYINILEKSKNNVKYSLDLSPNTQVIASSRHAPGEDLQFQEIFNLTGWVWKFFALAWCIVRWEIYSCFIVTVHKGPEAWNEVYWYAV